MNVIFLDFDGVINTIHNNTSEEIEKRIAILASICHDYGCKVVIEASIKDCIEEDTLEVEIDWVKNIFNLFKKYDIECIGRTPNVIKRYSNNSYAPIWKEDEIRLYLFRHPEIKHYCVIDDDDLYPHNSDLNKVRKHLVSPLFFSDNYEEEGLNLSYREQIKKALRKPNEIRKLALRRNKK